MIKERNVHVPCRKLLHPWLLLNGVCFGPYQVESSLPSNDDIKATSIPTYLGQAWLDDSWCEVLIVTPLIDVVVVALAQCDQKKSPNVYKSCPKIISLEKWLILTSLQKLPKNVGDLDKLIVAKVAQSPINRPIWSHCSCLPTFIPSYLFPSQCCKTWEFHSNVKKDFWLLLASAAED